MTNTTPDDALDKAYEAVVSDEYKEALAAQIDYDSTPEGQRVLEEKLDETTDPDEIRYLVARQVTGKVARRLGREFYAFVPPMIPRGQPGYAQRRALVRGRDELVRLMACAAAEANVWTRPAPATMEEVRAQLDEVVELEKQAGHKPSPWRHPHLFASASGPAPWLPHRLQRDADVGDVAILTVLGMDAAWLGKNLLVKGNPDAMFRWGYDAAPVPNGDGLIVVHAPDLTAWQKAIGLN